MFIDIHSHILNGVDDGAKTDEMSIDMLRMAEKSGTNIIIATPHFMRGRFNYEYNEVLQEINKLRKLAKDNCINVEILHGQEVYYTEKLPEYLNEGIIGTLNNSKYMLIELPMQEFNLDNVINVLFELQLKGIKPIIAHPERYKPFIKNPTEINNLINEGYLFQLNTGSLTGDFGREVKKTAELYLENKIYNFAGSDGHRNEKRNTDISRFLEAIDRENLMRFKESSKSMINNEEVEFHGNKIKRKKKILGIF